MVHRFSGWTQRPVLLWCRLFLMAGQSPISWHFKKELLEEYIDALCKYKPVDREYFSANCIILYFSAPCKYWEPTGFADILRKASFHTKRTLCHRKPAAVIARWISRISLLMLCLARADWIETIQGRAEKRQLTVKVMSLHTKRHTRRPYR